jgi:hypothetical protein
VELTGTTGTTSATERVEMDTSTSAERPGDVRRLPDLGAEVRASLLLLGLCAGVLVSVTVVAQTTLSLLG